jgi:hypothetical protein
LTAIIDAVASLAIQKVKVLPSPVLQYEPVRRGTRTPPAPRHATPLMRARGALHHTVLQFDNPFEEGGVTKVELVAPTAKTNKQAYGNGNQDEDEEEEEEDEGEEGPLGTEQTNGSHQSDNDKVRSRVPCELRLSRLLTMVAW